MPGADAHGRVPARRLVEPGVEIQSLIACHGFGKPDGGQLRESEDDAWDRRITHRTIILAGEQILAGDPAFVGCDRSQVWAAVTTIAGSDDGRDGGARDGAELDAQKVSA